MTVRPAVGDERQDHRVTAPPDPAAPTETWIEGKGRRWVGLAGAVAVVLAIEILVRSGLVDARFLPPPSEVGARLPSLLVGGPLLGDLVSSVRSIVTGVLLGHVVALPLVALAYRHRWFRVAITPTVEFVRGIAPLALLPAFLLLFGIGAKAGVAVITWCAWVPLYINILEGLDAVDPAVVRAARSMCASPAKLVTSVYVPSVVGHYFSALRLAIGAGWLAVVAAEMLGSDSGLGYRIFEFSQIFRIPDMYATIAVIGIVGLLTNAGVMRLQQRFTAWRTA